MEGTRDHGGRPAERRDGFGGRAFYETMAERREVVAALSFSLRLQAQRQGNPVRRASRRQIRRAAFGHPARFHRPAFRVGFAEPAAGDIPKGHYEEAIHEEAPWCPSAMASCSRSLRVSPKAGKHARAGHRRARRGSRHLSRLPGRVHAIGDGQRPSAWVLMRNIELVRRPFIASDQGTNRGARERNSASTSHKRGPATKAATFTVASAGRVWSGAKHSNFPGCPIPRGTPAPCRSRPGRSYRICGSHGAPFPYSDERRSHGHGAPGLPQSTDTLMFISEIFYSVQGEGELTGVPSVFIRTSAGCNLRCAWCDTPYASWRPEGENDPEVEEVVRRALGIPGGARGFDGRRADGCQGNAAPGGKPACSTASTSPLRRRALCRTAGHRLRPGVDQSEAGELHARRRARIAPEPGSSGTSATRFQPADYPGVDQCRYPFQLKFVVERPEADLRGDPGDRDGRDGRKRAALESSVDASGDRPRRGSAGAGKHLILEACKTDGVPVL